MNRFSRSWALAKQSWGVMKSNPSLAAFPVISAVAAFAVFLSFALPLFFTSIQPHLNSGKDFTEAQHSPLYYVVLFAFYVVNYFVIVFFNVGLVHCANETLEGRQTSVGDGLKAAGQRIHVIFAWALVSATVGTILRYVGERTGIVGRIVIALLGGAWTIVTYFVVPVLALEGVGPFAAIKESWATLKKTWGEAAIGNVGISFAVGLLSLIPIPLLILAGVATQNVWVVVALFAVSVVYWTVLGVISATLTTIYTTALYGYARYGTVPAAYSQDQLAQAFQPGKQKGRWG